MSGQFTRCTETLIVRLWVEYLEQTPPTWRGEIKHIKSEKVARFVDLGKMLEFIEGLAVKAKRVEE